MVIAPLGEEEEKLVAREPAASLSGAESWGRGLGVFELDDLAHRRPWKLAFWFRPPGPTLQTLRQARLPPIMAVESMAGKPAGYPDSQVSGVKIEVRQETHLSLSARSAVLCLQVRHVADISAARVWLVGRRPGITSLLPLSYGFLLRV